MKLEIINFIKNNKNWESLLKEKPYCLNISRDVFNNNKLILFKYNQIYSDFSLNLCKECRGLILNEDTLEPVSIPFFKFFNYGEQFADNIDFLSSVVTEKIDGSLIKIVRIKDQLLVSTNGTILAKNAKIPEQIGCNVNNFFELIWEAIKNIDDKFVKNNFEFSNKFIEMFECNKTYMFEVVSPFTKIVVPFSKIDIYFLGLRDNFSLNEQLFINHEFNKIFKTPKTFKLNSFNDCIIAAQNLSWDHEGYVIVDSLFHRNKVKSPGYLSCHHLKNNGILSYERAIQLIQLNEIGEVLTYFPEFEKEINEVKHKFFNCIDMLEKYWNDFSKLTFNNRKEQALYINKTCKIPGVIFRKLDGKIDSIHDYFFKETPSKVMNILNSIS